MLFDLMAATTSTICFNSQIWPQTRNIQMAAMCVSGLQEQLAKRLTSHSPGWPMQVHVHVALHYPLLPGQEWTQWCRSRWDHWGRFHRELSALLDFCTTSKRHRCLDEAGANLCRIVSPFFIVNGWQGGIFRLMTIIKGRNYSMLSIIMQHKWPSFLSETDWSAICMYCQNQRSP